MNDSIKKLLSKEITWAKNPNNGKDFYAEVDGTPCELIIGDFPDEPLFTLFFDGEELSFNDEPVSWEIPWES